MPNLVAQLKEVEYFYTQRKVNGIEVIFHTEKTNDQQQVVAF